jgi:hypothetical protein
MYFDPVLVNRAAVAEDEEDDFDEEQPFIPTTFGRSVDPSDRAPLMHQ